MKTLASSFSVDGKRFENGALRKDDVKINPVIALSEFSSKTKPH